MNAAPAGLIAAMKALYSGGPLSPDELVEFDRLRAAEAAKFERERAADAKFRDLVDFAKEHAFGSTPKYQREAVRCLERAAEMIRRNGRGG